MKTSTVLVGAATALAYTQGVFDPALPDEWKAKSDDSESQDNDSDENSSDDWGDVPTDDNTSNPDTGIPTGSDDSDDPWSNPGSGGDPSPPDTGPVTDGSEDNQNPDPGGAFTQNGFELPSGTVWPSQEFPVLWGHTLATDPRWVGMRTGAPASMNVGDRLFLIMPTPDIHPGNNIAVDMGHGQSALLRNCSVSHLSSHSRAVLKRRSVQAAYHAESGFYPAVIGSEHVVQDMPSPYDMLGVWGYEETEQSRTVPNCTYDPVSKTLTNVPLDLPFSYVTSIDSSVDGVEYMLNPPKVKLWTLRVEVEATTNRVSVGSVAGPDGHTVLLGALNAPLSVLEFTAFAPFTFNHPSPRFFRRVT